MKIRTTAFTVTMLVMFAVAAGCAADDTEETSSDTAALSERKILTCSSLAVERGRIGSGQSASALAVRDQSGTADSWSKYVEFYPNTSAVCSFRLPAGTAASGVSNLDLRLNYRGPTKRAMTWKFEVFDAQSSSWIPVGDNTFAASWRWSATTMPMGSNPARFFAGDTLKVRYSTTSSRDASLLDELVVLATTSSTTTTTDAGTTTDSGTSTADSGTATPPPTGGIWQPKPGTTWQWQLTGTIDTNVDAAMYDVDLYDAPQSVIDTLHAKGRKVICYFSAGSYENWRSDASQFPAAALGNNLDGWPGERWLDIRNTTVRSIMAARMDLAAKKKCDGVEPDNIDGYSNNSGFPLTSANQIDYNKFLATTAHDRNLSIGLKNDLDQVSALVSSFDFAVNEECVQWNECGMLTPFISAGKAVFHVEYGSASLANTVCPKTKPLGFSTLIKELNLGAWRVTCP